MIKDCDVDEFIIIFNKEFGVQLNHDEAYKKLSRLVRQLEIIYKPISKIRYKEYVNEDGKNEQVKASISE
jgi:hypothetical protein